MTSDALGQNNRENRDSVWARPGQEWGSNQGKPLGALQSRFASTESEASKADTTRWWVPLTYVQDGDNFDSPKKMWLDPSAASTSIAGEGKKWIVANIKQTGKAAKVRTFS